jgi:fumarate reductase flavoprotein subunit
MMKRFREATKNLAALLLGLILLSTMGCSNDSDPAPDKVVDVVVVGSGIAGIMAAIGAKDAGASNVLLIEKGAFGGTTRRAAGGFSDAVYNVAASSFDTAKTVWKNQADPDTDTAAEITGYPDYERYYLIAKENKRVRDYMRDTTTGLNVPSNGTGSVVIMALEAQVEAKGIEVLLLCKAEEILMENGVVSGVRATYNEKAYRIKAKSVILATGGFSHNLTLVKQWAGTNPGLKDVDSLADPGSTGDGVVMAQAVGAVLFNNTFTDAAGINFSSTLAAKVAETVGINGYSAFTQPEWYTAPALKMQSQILVDNTGKRILNENGTIAYNPGASKTLIRKNTAPYFVIYDSTNADEVIPDQVYAGTYKINQVHAGTYKINDALAAGAALTDLKEVVKGETLGELATAMGLTGQAAADFVAEVAKYNGFVTTQKDDDFSKPASQLTKKIETGPYYAVKLYPNTFGSMGGIKTDAKGRVLNADGGPIPHLYAAGEVSNRDFYNQTYAGASSLALYSTIGYVAGETAVADTAE